MAYNPDMHHRRSIRLPGYDYAQEGAYFVTIVTAERECLFGEVVDAAMHLSPLGTVAAGCWQAIPQHFPRVEIDEWVIMPNHVHGIIVLAPVVPAGTHLVVGAQHAAPLPSAPLPSVLLPPAPPQCVFAGDGPPADVPRVAPGSLGAIVRSFKSTVTKRAGEMAGMPGVRVWQRNYYDHIVRNERQLERLRRYIDENPERWDLDSENPARVRARARE